MNAKFWIVLGYDPDEMPHKSSAWQGIINQDDLKVANENFTQHCEDPQHPYDQVVRYTHKNGSTVWVRCRGMAIRDENGKAIRMLGAHHDITRLKQAEEKYAQAERTYKEIFNGIEDSLIIHEVGTGVIVDVNNAMLKNFGYSRDDLSGLTIVDLSGKDASHTKRQAKEFIKRASTGETVVFEWLNKKKNGNLFNSEITLKQIYISGNKRIMAVVRDITKRKRAEVKLRQSEESSRKKIQAILEPKGDIGTLNLGDIIDRESLQALIEDFYRIARVPTAMVDLAGETLIQVGFQDICVKFHRNHPESMKNCHEAATILADGVAPGTFKAYRCKNNLWDIVTPIVVGGNHLGNIIIGQFLYEDETPDYELFKSQAHQYGFNEAEYLSALDRIPRLSREMVEATIGFYSKLAGMISSLSYSKINLSRTLTERKEAEEALIHSHKLMKYIIEHTHSAVAVHDKDLKYIYVSQRYIDDYNIQTKDIIGKHHYEVFPDLPQKWRDVHQKALAGEVLSADDDPYVREDGSVEWTRWECRPWFEKDGSLGGIIVYTEVITERKRTEKELEMFKTIAENAVYGKAIADGDGNLVYVNDYFAKIHDYKKEELIGKNLSVFHNEHQRKDIERLIREMLQTGYFAPTEVWHIKRDGTEFPTLMTGVTVKDEIRNTTFLASTAIDITRQKQTEANLIKAKEKAEESEKEHRNLIETLGEGYLRADKNGYITRANNLIASMSDYNSAEEMIGLHMKKLYANPNDRDVLITKVREKGVLHNYEVLLRKKNGNTYWTLSNVKLVYDKNGEIIGTEGLIRDISPLKKVELELISAKARVEDSEKKLQSILDNMLDLVATCDLQGNYKFVGPSHKILGYDVEWLTGKNVMEFVHPDDLPHLQSKFVSFLENKTNRTQKERYRYLCSDGSYLWFETIGTVMCDENDNPVEILFVTRDITEQIGIEKELQFAKEKAEESEIKFRAFTEQSPHAIYLTDLNGDCIYVNQKWLELSGMTFNEAMGKGWTNALYEEDKKHISEKWYKSVNSRGQWSYEYRFINKQGEIIWVEGTAKELMNSKGDAIGFLGTNTNITDRKKAEEALILAKEKAEESDRLKSAFLANMSHEIRTPMNGILGFAELLKEPGLQDDAQQKYIAVIEKSGKRMLNLINDIVDISRIEAGYVELNMKDSDINEMIQELFDFFKPEAEAKAIKLSLNNPLPENQAIIKTDREKTYAVLANLVKNAIKYTEKGEIEFGVDHNEDFLEFYVKDTGIGIPEDRQEAIFNRFVQADIEDKMARQGAGLGLAISKAYVEMLGGKIWVESQEGKGSTFYFTLPCNA